MQILERFADLYFEKIILKRVCKTYSRAPYCTFIAGSEHLPLKSQRSKVRIVFIGSIFSEIIKQRQYFNF